MARLTIPSETTYARFTVTGSTSAFAITFRLFAKADLSVTVDDVELSQSDFSFSGTLLDDGGYAGGTVTLNHAVEDCTVVIWRDIASTRTTNFAPSNSVPVRVVDTALNRVAAQVQDLQRDMARAAKVPLGSTGGSAEDLIDSVLEQAEAAGEAAGTTAGAAAATAAVANKASIDLSDVTDANFGGKASTVTGGLRSRSIVSRAMAITKARDYAVGTNNTADVKAGIDAMLTEALSLTLPHKRMDLESGLYNYVGALLINDRRNVTMQGSGHWTVDGATQVYFSPTEGGDYGMRLSSAYGHHFSDMAFRMKTGATAMIDINADAIPDLSGVGAVFERVLLNPILSGSNGASGATMIVSEQKQLLLSHAFFSPNNGRPVLQLGRPAGSAPGTYMNGNITLGVVTQSYFFGDVMAVNVGCSVIEASQFPANACILSNSSTEHEAHCLVISANGFVDEDRANANAATPDTITITRSGSVATVVTSKRHRLLVGDYCRVVGADQTEYNGRFTVASVVDAYTFTYAVSGTPASPATGVDEVHFGVPAIRTSNYAGTSQIARGGTYAIFCNDIRDRLLSLHLRGYGHEVFANSIGARHSGGEELGCLIDADADGVVLSVSNDWKRCWDNGNVAVLDNRTELKDQFILDEQLASTLELPELSPGAGAWADVFDVSTRRPIRGGKSRVEADLPIYNAEATAQTIKLRIVRDGDTANPIVVRTVSVPPGYSSVRLERPHLSPGDWDAAAIKVQLYREAEVVIHVLGSGTDGRAWLVWEELP